MRRGRTDREIQGIGCGVVGKGVREGRPLRRDEARDKTKAIPSKKKTVKNEENQV